LKKAKEFKKIDNEILKSLKPFISETEEKDTDGNNLIFETRKTPFFNKKGTLLGLIGISRDITERKKAELRVKSQSVALKSTANGVVITNTKGEIVWVNPAFRKLTGYSWEELIGENPRILSSGKHDKAFYEEMWNTITAGETWHGEIINKKKDGTLFHEEMTITPILDDKGKIIQFVAIKNDITERKELEKILLKAKQRMEDELNVAKDIQMSMLPLTFPAFPKRDEIDIYAKLIPAREVGGDFYDFYFLDKNHLCFVMGDVSGKGVPAALMMAVTKTLLKSRAGNDKSTASILTHVNNEIAKENEACMFITVFMAILNTNTGELVYSNAGHNPSYVISKENKEITKLRDLHGPVIGAMEDMTYRETQLFLKTKDIVLAYTDGVTESQNIKEELYSDARFEKLLKTGEYNSSKALTKLIIESVKEFEGDADQFDDITVMAIEYCQNPKKVSSINSSIKIKNDLKEIANAIEWFEAFGLENKMAFVIIQKFNIAFDELLNNIISYSYNDEDEHLIDIDIELKDERLIITISDDGIPFNPFIIGPPDTTLSVEDRYIGGLGIHIVKNLMDEYDYKRHVNNNIITLIKYNINT
jgi:sigma-B regulation protein RsbU (phosphoserine phosphatase)